LTLEESSLIWKNSNCKTLRFLKPSTLAITRRVQSQLWSSTVLRQRLWRVKWLSTKNYGRT